MSPPSAASFLLLSAMKDLRRRMVDPLGLAGWIGLPLALGLMIAAMGGAFDAPSRARVLLVDRGDPLLRRLLSARGPLDGGGARSAPRLDFERVGWAEGRARVERGDAAALLVAPEGLSRSIALGRPCRIALETDPGRPLLAGLIRERLDAFVEEVERARRIVAGDLRALATSGARGTALGRRVGARLSAAMRARRRRLRVGEVSLGQVAARRDAGDPAAMRFLPGVLLMSMLLIAAGMSADVWAERRAHTLRRALGSPHGIAVFLGGKLLAGATLMAGVSSAGVLLALPALHTSWWCVPAAAMLATLTGAALLCLFLLVHVHCPDHHSARLVVSMVLFPLLMLGGSFFPLPQMPAALALIGRWTPNGLASIQLQALLSGGADPGALMCTALALGAPAALAFALAARRVQRSFGRG